MQGVDGSKGSQVIQFNNLLSLANETININATLRTTHTSNDSAEIGWMLSADQVFKRVARNADGTFLVGSVNLLNRFPQDNEKNTPLEFNYEAADCKLFYTCEKWFDP